MGFSVIVNTDMLKSNTISFKKIAIRIVILSTFGVLVILASVFLSNLSSQKDKTRIEEIHIQLFKKIVHLLFGLFIAAILDTKALYLKGIKTIHTIHNIPP